MFDNLKAGDTIKIGEKEFKVLYVDGALEIKNSKGERDTFTTNELEFLGAEIVRKAPPKYTPVKWVGHCGDVCFGLSYGKLHDDGHGCLGVLVGSDDTWVKDWEVLEIEK